LTYNGHPLACAAGVATIEVYKEDRLIENAATLGKHLGSELEELKTRHPSVGDVRYIGLFSTIELVQNPAAKNPIPPNTMTEIGKYLRSHGVFTYIMSGPMGSMIFIVPPLCITKDQLDEGLSIIDEALALSDKVSA
jgi:taurine--2-oxoglutarate transaminase